MPSSVMTDESMIDDTRLTTSTVGKVSTYPQYEKFSSAGGAENDPIATENFY